MSLMSESSRNREENLLYQILRELDRLGTTLTAGGAGDGGWTDDGTTVRLTTATDDVGVGTATTTHKLTVAGDDTSILKVSGTVSPGVTSEIEMSNSLLGGFAEGTAINYYPTATTVFTVMAGKGSDDIVGGAFVAYLDLAGSQDNVFDVQPTYLDAKVTDAGTTYIGFRASDPEGVCFQGADTGSTNYIIRALTSVAAPNEFTGSMLFGVRNDGAIFTGASQGASGSFTTADAKTVTVTNGLITSIV